MATIITDSIRLKDSGEMKPWKAANMAPGHAAESSTHTEGQQLHVAGVDAHRFGSNFVFTDGHPGASDARTTPSDGK